MSEQAIAKRDRDEAVARAQARQAKYQELCQDISPERVDAIVAGMFKIPAIKRCEPASVWESIYGILSLNLDPEPKLGQAYVIPYGRQAQMVIGYKGLVTLAGRAGVQISSGVVRSGDLIELEERSSGLHFLWRPANVFDRAEDTIVGAYAAFRVGGVLLHVELTPVEVGHDLREKAKRGTPWHVHFAKMLRKTPIRRGFGAGVPLDTAKTQALASLIAQDAEVEGQAMGTSPDRVIQVEAGTELDQFASGALGEREPEQAADQPRDREPGDDDDSWMDEGQP